MTIAAGYHTVTKPTLQRLGKDRALTFVYEMMNRGGRIGRYEYIDWVKWINSNL